MKKIIRLFTLFIFLFASTTFFAQPEPPDPGGDPNDTGEDELGGDAPIGSGLIILGILGGAYATARTLQLRSNPEEHETED